VLITSGLLKNFSLARFHLGGLVSAQQI
jgi:hypothetical protein